MTPHQIRAAYIQALENGMSHADATAHANGLADGTVEPAPAPAPPSDPVQPKPAKAEPEAGASDPDAEITREMIEEMKKADVIELLQAHGIESPEGVVADLRAQLITIMFTDVGNEE